jgi:hypothetical protein
VEDVMFRITSCISRGLAIAVIVIGLAGAATAQDSTCRATGDVNCDGYSGISDLIDLIQFFSSSEGELNCPYEADINMDCVVDNSDYQALIVCLTELRPFMMCEEWWPCCNPIVKPCCLGDPNRSGGEPTVADISTMIDAKFITGTCNDICIGAADLNGSGGDSPTCNDITINDISMLIDCLFITGDISPCYETCWSPSEEDLRVIRQQSNR